MPDTSQPVEQPSILGQLYAMRDNPDAEPTKVVEAPKPVTPEPAKAETTETAAGTVETQPEVSTETDDHTPLPPAVQKRIDKEIARAVSARKEAEAERDRLKAAPGKQDTEPAKPAPVASTKPVMPDDPEFGETGHESETWEQYSARRSGHKAAMKKYHEDVESWHAKTTREQVTAELEGRQAREAHEATVKQAIKEHGEDFVALTEVVAGKAPMPMQQAILEMDDWPSLAVYLARNPERLDEVVTRFEKSPAAAIATLGRIQASLKGKAPKQQASEVVDTSLPAPLRPVGGGAAATQPHPDLNELAKKPGALLTELKHRYPERVMARR